jgi:hypothetical protein
LKKDVAGTVSQPTNIDIQIPYGHCQEEVGVQLRITGESWNTLIQGRREVVREMMSTIPEDESAEETRSQLEKLMQKIRDVEDALLKTRSVLQRISLEERSARERFKNEAAKRKAMDIVSKNFPELIGYEPDYWLANRGSTIDAYNVKVAYLRNAFLFSEEERECIVPQGREEEKLPESLEDFGIPYDNVYHMPGYNKVSARIPASRWDDKYIQMTQAQKRAMRLGQMMRELAKDDLTKIEDNRYGEYESRLRKAVTKSAASGVHETTPEAFAIEMENVDEESKQEVAKYSQAEKTAVVRKLFELESMKAIAEEAENRPDDIEDLRASAEAQGMRVIEAAFEQVKRKYERLCRTAKAEGKMLNVLTIGDSIRSGAKCSANRHQRKAIEAKKRDELENQANIASGRKKTRASGHGRRRTKPTPPAVTTSKSNARPTTSRPAMRERMTGMNAKGGPLRPMSPTLRANAGGSRTQRSMENGAIPRSPYQSHSGYKRDRREMNNHDHRGRSARDLRTVRQPATRNINLRQYYHSNDGKNNLSGSKQPVTIEPNVKRFLNQTITRKIMDENFFTGR